jgi:hypothetical protein
MILVWNDIKSFRRHLEAMKTFRKSHGVVPAQGLPMKDMPLLRDMVRSLKGTRVTTLTGDRGKLIFVPIWDVEAEPGSQN